MCGWHKSYTAVHVVATAISVSTPTGRIVAAHGGIARSKSQGVYVTILGSTAPVVGSVVHIVGVGDVGSAVCIHFRWCSGMIPKCTWTCGQAAKETGTAVSSCHVAGAAICLSFMNGTAWSSVVANYSAVFTCSFGVAPTVGSKAAIG